MHEPSIVRAMLSPPQRTRTLEVPQPPPSQPTPHHQATARFTVPMDEHTVPHLRAGLDIALQPLHPFEAHIASFIDGVQPVPELARAARLPEIEVKVVLKGLLERGLVELHRTPGAPFPRTPTGEMPVLDGQDFLSPEPMALGDEDDEPTPAPRRPPPRAAAPARPPAPEPSVVLEPTLAATPARGTAPARPLPASTPPRGLAPASSTPARGTAPVPPPTRSTTSMPAVQLDVAPPPSRGPAPMPDVHARATVSVQAVQPRPPPRSVQPLEAPPTTGGAPPPTTPEDFLQRASRLERQGEVERAIEVLTRAIEKVPEAAVLYSKLALILVHQRKDYARAVQLLERASELEPENTVLQQNLLKVTSLAAAAGGRKEEKRGLFARLTGRR